TDANISLPYTAEVAPEGWNAVKLEVKGLKGGHSGMEIILQRANSNKLMCRFLKTFMDKFGILLCDIDGGGLRNAIPREAFATVAVLKQYEKKFLAAVKRYEKLYQTEFKDIEDSISFKAVPVKCPSKCIDIFDTQDLIDAVVGLPNGIVKMSTTMPGLVQTSTNLARVVSEKGKFTILCLLRSSVRSEKEALAQQMKTVCEMAGASVKLSGAYDGWNPNPESAILHTMQEGYQALYGKKPEIMAIHAGLECGIIGGVYPKMDMISFGPTICYPHSPDEKVNIASVEKFYNYLCYTLEHAPLK
ncbi:MAG: M20/M25/M40 family metallo-hydrolase, partial [Tidjanibacter sp.]|nr:M20/M25/M40 family metallo-hydrolase [Tidjanibacter sp.]